MRLDTQHAVLTLVLLMLEMSWTITRSLHSKVSLGNQAVQAEFQEGVSVCS